MTEDLRRSSPNWGWWVVSLLLISLWWHAHQLDVIDRLKEGLWRAERSRDDFSSDYHHEQSLRKECEADLDAFHPFTTRWNEDKQEWERLRRAGELPRWGK